MPAVRSHEPVAEIVPSFHFSGLLFRRLRSAGVRNPDRRTRSGQFPGAERSRLRGGAARNVVRPDLDHDGQGVESLVRGLRTLHIRDRTGGSRRTENASVKHLKQTYKTLNTRWLQKCDHLFLSLEIGRKYTGLHKLCKPNV